MNHEACCLCVTRDFGARDDQLFMRSLESLNQAVGTLLDWDPGMSMESLDDAAHLDVRIMASRTHYHMLS